MYVQIPLLTSFITTTPEIGSRFAVLTFHKKTSGQDTHVEKVFHNPRSVDETVRGVVRDTTRIPDGDLLP